MARYTSDSKERVREAVDMVDLVGTRTELRRSGADSYVGLCPFHEERTPSFGIRPSGKVYYCFGCQAAGDAFSFVMETEGLEFVAAMEYLAERYGVTLELADEDPRAANERRRQARLLELLERTCSYYERVLWDHSEGARAREYLAGRGLEEAVLREFRVGFAPSAWDRVLLGSRRSGFSEAELLAAGVVQRSRDRPGSVYDRFRRRITFPLCDQRGHVLGFGARAMGSDQQPKYVNSADGAIYHKGRHLFGTHLARSHAAKAGAIVLCEGYTDVIAAHQAGVRNCVGLMGTALTEEQVGGAGPAGAERGARAGRRRRRAGGDDEGRAPGRQAAVRAARRRAAAGQRPRRGARARRARGRPGAARRLAAVRALSRRADPGGRT